MTASPDDYHLRWMFGGSRWGRGMQIQRANHFGWSDSTLVVQRLNSCPSVFLKRICPRRNQVSQCEGTKPLCDNGREGGERMQGETWKEMFAKNLTSVLKKGKIKDNSRHMHGITRSWDQVFLFMRNIIEQIIQTLFCEMKMKEKGGKQLEKGGGGVRWWERSGRWWSRIPLSSANPDQEWVCL